FRPEQCCQQREQSKQQGVPQPAFTPDSHQLQQPQQQEGDRAYIADQKVAVLVELRKHQDRNGGDQGKSVRLSSGGSPPTDLHDQCNESKGQQRVDKRVDDLSADKQVDSGQLMYAGDQQGIGGRRIPSESGEQSLIEVDLRGTDVGECVHVGHGIEQRVQQRRQQ